MDLGGLAEFRYVPEFRGNRDQPDEEQVSVVVKRLTAIDVLQDLTPEQLRKWRDEAFHKWAVTEKVGDTERVTGFEKIAAGLEMVPPEMLSIFRRVITHTHGYRNITVDGRAITDPAEIFLVARIPDSLEQADNLLVELYTVLRNTSALSEAELGNFLQPSDGGLTQSNTSAKDVAEGASRKSAKGKVEQVES